MADLEVAPAAEAAGGEANVSLGVLFQQGGATIATQRCVLARRMRRRRARGSRAKACAPIGRLSDAFRQCSTDDLFRSLEGRALTTNEQDIIAQRVALQRKMADEYDRREKTRKVRSDSKRFRRPPHPAAGAARPGAPAAHGCGHATAAEACFAPRRATQLREIKTVCPDVTDEEALAALEDKGGKCVAAAASARLCHL